jgi:hypothetical protein
MPLQTCSGTTGFPITLSQKLFSLWQGGFNPSDAKVLNQITSPVDFSISWSPSNRNVNLSVDTSQSKFNINGLLNESDTTLVYGSAMYTCMPSLSIVNIQHANLTEATNATQELIMTFRIKDQAEKRINPSSPEIILLCRPVILSGDPNTATNFWASVNTSASNNNSIQTTYTAAESFTYDGNIQSPILLPMISYNTCISSKLIGSGKIPKNYSTHIKVNVITKPLNIFSSGGGTGKCAVVSRFIMPVTGLADIFNQDGYTHVEFTTGPLVESNTPTSTTRTLSNILTVPQANENLVTSWQSSSGAGSVLQKFQYLVPESFLGKSLSEISSTTANDAAPLTRKAFKCYTIDPRKDIVSDQILIDPTTGQSLTDTMKQELRDSSGGDPALAAALSGKPLHEDAILPGDIEEILLIVITTFGSIGLLAFVFYTLRLFIIRDYENGMIYLLVFGLSLLFLTSISVGLSSKIPK